MYLLSKEMYYVLCKLLQKTRIDFEIESVMDFLQIVNDLHSKASKFRFE